MSRPPEIDNYEKQHPLVRFSFYANGRVQVLLGLRVEILRELDKAFEHDPTLSFEHLARAEELSWLWILGAYEVIRTMCQAKQCFSERAQASLAQMKKDLAQVRMPAAKMEAVGKDVPIDSLRNPAGPPESGSDMQVGDPSDHRSLRELMNQFYGVITQIDHSDVLASHESSYHKPGRIVR